MSGSEGDAPSARHDGGPTARQREVLALVARGHTSEEIADRLGIARSTVERHILEARARLCARTRAQAAALVVHVSAKGVHIELLRDDCVQPGEADFGEARGRGCPLTCEERRLLELLAVGQALGEAAETLHLSRRTADRRLAAARGKLGVGTTAEALVVAREP